MPYFCYGQILYVPIFFKNAVLPVTQNQQPIQSLISNSNSATKIIFEIRKLMKY